MSYTPTPRSNTFLTDDFPIDTTAHLQASIVKFDNLAQNGALGQKDEVTQLEQYLGAAIDAIAETFVPTTAVVGTAGTAERKYVVVPRYPIPANMRFVAGAPAQGGPGGRSFVYGKVGTVADVTTAPNTFDVNDYVTVTAPALGAHSPAATTFDILIETGASTFVLLAANVAPGASVNDQHTAAQVATLPAYVPYPHAEFGIDGTGVLVFGPRTSDREI